MPTKTFYEVEDLREPFPKGTTMAPDWDADWIALVSEAEAERKMAICGARRGKDDLKNAIERGRLDEDEIRERPVLLVCRLPAGFKTGHVGEGRCSKHGGSADQANLKTGQYSLLKHNKIGPRVEEFFDDPRLLDTRQAIGVVWAALDALLDEDEDITPERAGQITNMMDKVGRLVKTHEDITSKKKISIEVPEFMAWVEHFFETAIKYIQEQDGDVAGFLREGQQFFDATVTLTIGGPRSRDSIPALGDGSNQ